MPPRSEPVPRARAALHWLIGFLLLGVMAGGVVAAAAALWQSVDVESLARSAAAVDEPLPVPPERLGPMAAAGTGRPAAVLVSEASRGFFPDPDHYDGIIRSWIDLLGSAGAGSHRIFSADEIAALEGGALLVAPQAACLSVEEVEAMQAHVARGGGLVITWATGSRDSACDWRGWDPLLSFAGADNLAEIDAPEPLFVTFPAALPLSAGLPPGCRIGLVPGPRLAVQIAGPRGYWSDWALNRREPPSEDRLEGGGPDSAIPDAAAALRVTPEGGRIAWFGFDVGQGATPGDEWRLRQALVNGTRWAAGRLMAEISPWPDDYRAVALIGEDVESGFRNSLELARILSKRGASATFFIVTGLAGDDPGIADSLRLAGEIGSQTTDHNATAGLPLREQTLRLGRSWRQARAWSGVPPAGLRPPEERFDDNTLRAWRDVGGSYVVALNDARSAAPEIFDTPSGPVVLLPRLLNDDYNVFVQEGSRDPADLATAWMEGIRKLVPLGGLSYLSLRTQVGGAPERVWIVESVLDSLEAHERSVWLATGREVSDWWLSRASLELSLTADAERAVLLVRAERAVEGAWVDVYGLPAAGLVPFAESRPLPYSRTPWGLRLPLPHLTEAGEIEIVLVPDAEE